jgi:D-alanyl-D-alanine endopeptidase (penicillin-binding protein 7)
MTKCNLPESKTHLLSVGLYGNLNPMIRIVLLLLIALFALPANSGDQNQHIAGVSTKLLDKGKLRLRSEGVLIADHSGNILFSRNADTPRPIASVTKLMTAVVTLEAKLPLEEKITITKADRDLRQLTGSRLKVGATLTRKELLTLAMLSSENRAALALGRTYPGGSTAFAKAMNNTAKQLGMKHSNFIDAAGLSPNNLSTPNDLFKLMKAAEKHSSLKRIAQTRSTTVRPYKRLGPLRYVNTNRFSRNKSWSLLLSKTGFLTEAGRCLVMKASVDNQEVTMILLDSYGKLTPFGDANRAREWLKRYRKSA